jgi:hypothetical protein
MPLQAGNRVPGFRVHRRYNEQLSLDELVAEGPAVFHFHIFDFTGSDAGG